ncbi:hypothetical protein DFH08DRAFT_818675 [Mycena albidolilacea]|uniref:Uncharacterized protein n=1 Tax=Mycena albidolilacea TaxID=1033008 RepID=A0AAD6ZG67_9AGAR|nr:hypothetical protein DFH08DRAFT_818675 [Mycena albidolilacea]
MLFSPLVSFTFVAAFVRAQTTVPVTKIVNIQDFKGNVFDLAFGSTFELSPVQTLNHKTGATVQAASHCFICFRFCLTNGNNIAAQTFLSSTGAITGLNPTATQLCGHERAFQWNITVNGNKFNIIEPKTGEAATS